MRFDSSELLVGPTGRDQSIELYINITETVMHVNDNHLSVVSDKKRNALPKVWRGIPFTRVVGGS